MTLPNYLDLKKTKPKATYRPSSKPYVHRPAAAYGDFGGSQQQHYDFDFTPTRGGNGGGSDGSAGYSYHGSPPAAKYNYDDYHDEGPSSSPYDHYYSPSSGPKSFISVKNADEDGPDGVINIDHGHRGDESSKVKGSSPSYGASTKGSKKGPSGGGSYGHYYSSGPSSEADSDPLHPLRDYHSTGHDNEDMYIKLRHEYQSKAAKPKTTSSSSSSPYYYHRSDYQEPSSTSVHSTRHAGGAAEDDSAVRPAKKKAYWRMSFVQNG